MSNLNVDDDKLVFESSEQVEVISTFDQLGLKDDLLRGIFTSGFETPYALQQRAVLPMVSGRDVIVQAEAGMGKTSTTAIAILHSIDCNLRETQALILSPTREHATETQSVIMALGDYLNVQCHACIGGTSVAEDIRKLNYGVHVVSGTPGRVFDMIRRKHLRTRNIKMLVLDEADEMLNTGFSNQVYDVYRYLPPAAQVVFLGTTLPHDVLEMATKFMTKSIRMLLKSTESPLDRIKHSFVAVEEEERKFDTLCDLLDTLTTTQVIIFCNTKRKVDWLAEKMRDSKFGASFLHGDVPQKERDQIATDFRAGTCRVLITTDGRTRDIDRTPVSQVINYDLPNTHENYNHRVGRFGLPGRKVVAVNFVTVEDIKVLRAIEQYYSIEIDELPANAAEALRSPMSDVSGDDSEIGSEPSEQVELLSTFDERFLKDELLRGIHAYGFESPSAMQQRALLPMVSGRDVIIQAEAGMGKTSTIAMAILQRIDTAGPREVQALVLSPIRELATQTQSVITALGDFLHVECYACVGGISIRVDIKTLDNGVHVVSGTPGRVLDMIKRKKLRTQNMKMLVIEEADEMLSGKGFSEQVYDIYRYLPPATQVVFLGNTLPESVLEMATKLMKDPIRMLFKRDESALKDIEQYFVAVEKEQQMFESLCNLFDTLKISRAVIFCNAKRKVDWLAKEMRDLKFTVSSMHGGMPQEERDQSAADFRAGSQLVLITTDTRGIDMPEISHIINFGLPTNRENYIHRIHRFGLSGECKVVTVNLVRVQEVKILRDIEQQYNTQINELPVNTTEVIELW